MAPLRTVEQCRGSVRLSPLVIRRPTTATMSSSSPSFVILIISLLTVSCSSLEHHFSPHCGDQMHKEIACSVKIVDCNEDVMNFSPNGSPIPSEAHDLRIDTYSKALIKRNDGRSNYQLTVDVSWQMPPTNSTALLKAFLLLISEKNGRHETCVFFNVSTTEWTSDAITSSPRFHFSTDSMFKFDKSYRIELISLPETAAMTSKVDKQVSMPHNPALADMGILENCTRYSHPYASKWTAAFKRIMILQVARTIQVQFPAAPSQYCFEAYEVRLLDDLGLEHDSAVITLDSMRTEVINNRTEYYGEFNFTNLEVERNYTPQVIPMERASDGRCLCPVSGDPYDINVVCSCIAADSKPVRIPRIIPPTTPPRKHNGSGAIISGSHESDNGFLSTWWILLAFALVLIIVIVIIFKVIHEVYHRYKTRGKSIRIRFVDVGSAENGRAGGGSAGLLNGSASGGHTPLISTHAPTNVLIIYSHDCGAHEAAVVALAEYLRDVFDIEVHLDQWDQDDIDRNLMDYVSSSILKADKVLIINSVGAYQRYAAKIGQEMRIERTQPGAFDGMFVSQIDQALQHSQIISVRFVYSAFQDVLPQVNGSLQYVLPENLPPLLTAILNTPLKSDPRLAGHNPSLSRLQAAITRMDHLRRSDTLWFVNTHHRVPIVTKPAVKMIATPESLTNEASEEETALLVPAEPEEEEEELEEVPQEEVVEPTTSQEPPVLEPLSLVPPEQLIVVPPSQESPDTEDTGFFTQTRTTDDLDEFEDEPLVPLRIPQSPSRSPLRLKPEKHDRYIEDKLERGNDSGDSGVISDAEIRILS